MNTKAWRGKMIDLEFALKYFSKKKKTNNVNVMNLKGIKSREVHSTIRVMSENVHNKNVFKNSKTTHCQGPLSSTVLLWSQLPLSVQSPLEHFHTQHWRVPEAVHYGHQKTKVTAANTSSAKQGRKPLQLPFLGLSKVPEASVLRWHWSTDTEQERWYWFRPNSVPKALPFLEECSLPPAKVRRRQRLD